MKGKKTGGRKAGTPNAATAFHKHIITALIAEYSESGQMARDFKSLCPKDRLAVAEKMIQYILPKMQATTVDLNADQQKTGIEQTLTDLSVPSDP